ncbi:hypothetical protein HRR83_004404 [Exophiala dermatitidis]|uniref:FAD dependent oxidoreductase domain-containing protein n=2 Tax=Exophiala dermatitidis TaxID=5970 RepID=H6BQ29_EXODN|nr:uncharacterized protein HMPREF1120_02643 [Exophiala dermatitidis NIH/UT8656]KAJ4511558.1 hypothetical protein HRR73_006133 [Exophiala dermatitidis]EHY54475.1 hypothetical protein HMPREF1120_02643 [Exophiala dermatitidis NIH/UT8656]KAJ4517639.1 hypothetical protein HRR75_002857 [Exophiala dermatitidis]KAJ4521291.1 hypothetical protein HRR74_003114 [Exophiala dermatitidis]KAJ4541958.1 hypothetical protein HRR77_005849 [Exophiala dermatitidis]
MSDGNPPPVTTGPASLPSPNPTASFWQTCHPNKIADHRSTPDLPSKAAVVVIGTGMSGTFAVDELLRQLHPDKDKDSNPKHHHNNNSDDEVEVELLVLEARTTCSAATGRNGGHLQPVIHAESSPIIDFELRNFRHIESLVRDNDIPCDFRRLRGCVAFWNKEYFEEAKAALGEPTSAAVGHVRPDSTSDTPAPSQTQPAAPVAAITSPQHRKLVHVVEDAHELRQLRLQPGAVGAIVQEVAASLSPYKLVIWMWERLLERFDEGVLNLQTKTAVTAIERQHATTVPGNHINPEFNWLVRTTRGPVQARHVIITTNAYTSHILPEFSTLISPVQAQMSALIPPRHSPFSTGRLLPMSYGFNGIGSQDRVMGDYLVQNPHVDKSNRGAGGGGHLMLGGGRHLPPRNGVGVSDDSYVDKTVELYLRSLPERLDLGPERDVSGSAHQSSSSPGMLDIAASWTGIIGSSVDGHPWVGPVPGSPGLFLCAGYSGHGMTNAGLCGRHVAGLVGASLNPRQPTTPGSSNNWDLPSQYILTRQRMDAALGKAKQAKL